MFARTPGNAPSFRIFHLQIFAGKIEKERGGWGEERGVFDDVRP